MAKADAEYWNITQTTTCIAAALIEHKPSKEITDEEAFQYVSGACKTFFERGQESKTAPPSSSRPNRRPVPPISTLAVKKETEGSDQLRY